MITSKKEEVRNAILLATVSAIAYCSVYFARNILSAVSPQMVEQQILNEKSVGLFSSVYFVCYALGQLVNGSLGERFKARTMVCVGLAAAGLCAFAFPLIASVPFVPYAAYGLMGYFLSMIYAPLVKMVSENVPYRYTIRCNLAYTGAALLGTPLSGVAAASMGWKPSFFLGSGALLGIAAVCFAVFKTLEKKHIINYRPVSTDKRKGGWGQLWKRDISLFTLLAMITGVVRTAVVFWLPLYIAQYLRFPADTASLMFTASTFVLAGTSFASVILYEIVRNCRKLMLYPMVLSTLCFVGCYFIHQPIVNVILLVLGVFFADTASSSVYAVYCPSLADIGMVSTATGFLDFSSYIGAAVASSVFGNAVGIVGWNNLILIWIGLVAIGTTAAFFMKKNTAAEINHA